MTIIRSRRRQEIEYARQIIENQEKYIQQLQESCPHPAPHYSYRSAAFNQTLHECALCDLKWSTENPTSR